MLQEFFLHRVLAGPGDGAQPPGDGRPGATPGFQLPGERLDVSATDGEQAQAAGAAPGGELAQVKRVRLAGQGPVSGQVPGKGEPFGIGEGGLDRGEGSGWGGSGQRAPPGRAGTELGPAARLPAVKRKLNVSRPAGSHYATNQQVPVNGSSRENAPYRRLCPQRCTRGWVARYISAGS